MASISSTMALLIHVSMISYMRALSSTNFHQDFHKTWGHNYPKILKNGDFFTLSLDKTSGSGFQSKNEYLFGKLDLQIKLVPGNSAGIVTAYYLSSEWPKHDEIDFEFLGNVSGEPYTLHTNVYTMGNGNREQQFRLWFDPTSDFYTYSILWNPRTIIFSVDGTPIREFKNLESEGVPYLNSRPMRMHSSLWNGEDWATRGGLVKTNWSEAPFIASYRSYNVDACVWSSGSSSCDPSASSSDNSYVVWATRGGLVKTNWSEAPFIASYRSYNVDACVWSSGSSSCDPSASSSDNSYAWLHKEMDAKNQEILKWARKNYMIYDYCSDSKRFPQGLPAECAFTTTS